MNKFAAAVKLAQAMSKLSPAQRAAVKNASQLRKIAAWVIEHPTQAVQLKNALTQTTKIAASKTANKQEPKFTLKEALHIIGETAGQIVKQAANRRAAEDAEATKLARVIQLANRKLTSK